MIPFLARRRLLSLPVILATMGAPRPISSASAASVHDWRATDPVLYEHLVVEGVISNAKFVEVEPEQIDASFSRFLPRKPAIAILELSDVKLLRGTPLRVPLYANIFVDWPRLVGQRVVLCARWWPELGGYLVLRGQASLFSTGTDWRRVDPDETLSDVELKARIAQVQPEAVANRANLVVTGTVISLEDSVVTADSKYIGRVTKVTIDHVEITKGAPSGRVVRFNICDWVADNPTLNVGEEWMAFLESRDGALWLVAGVNGLLKLGDNDKAAIRRSRPIPTFEATVH